MQLVRPRAGWDPHSSDNKLTVRLFFLRCWTLSPPFIHSIIHSFLRSFFLPKPEKHLQRPGTVNSKPQPYFERTYNWTIVNCWRRETSGFLCPANRNPASKGWQANHSHRHQQAHPWPWPLTRHPGPLTISAFVWVGGFRSAQRPEGNDDLVRTNPFSCVLLRDVGEELRLIW